MGCGFVKAQLNKTAGELVFEEYLESARISFQFEQLFPGSSRPPDYSLEHEGNWLLFDVKDFRGQAKDFRATGFSSYDPYAPIRIKIEKGKAKFKNLKTYPCALVLYNDEKPLVDLRPLFIYGAMLGNVAFSFPVDTTTGTGDLSKETTVFAGGGKMIQYGPRTRPIGPLNTTISAVIVIGRLMVGQKLCLDWLKEEEEKLGRRMTWHESVKAIESCAGTPKDVTRTELRVIVRENPYARIKWPQSLFRGSWDEHYGMEGDYIRRLYAGADRLEWETMTGTVADFSR